MLFRSRDVLVTAEQLPEILAMLRGAPTSAAPAPSASVATSAPAGGADDDPYADDPVARGLERYPEEEGDSDEDAWGLTGRE